MKRSNRKSEAGFSMMELMVSAAIFLVVMSAVFGVLQVGKLSRDTINNSSETINNARMSINAVGRDAINAGLGYSRVGAIIPDDVGTNLLGIPSDSGTERDVFTAVIAGNDVTTSALSVGTEKNDIVAFMYRDLEFNNGSPVIINSTQVSGNHIDLEGAAGSCALCNKYDLFLIESSNGNHALGVATSIRDSNSTVRFAFNDPLNMNRKTSVPDDERSILTPCGSGQTSNCFSYSPQATIKKVYLVSYKVDSSGTLVRTIYGNNTGALDTEQIREFPLAHNVQHFQVRYLMSDGTFNDDPSSATNSQGNLNEVIQVEVSVTIKPDQTQGQVTSTQLVKLSSTFSTRNLKYDVE